MEPSTTTPHPRHDDLPPHVPGTPIPSVDDHDGHTIDVGPVEVVAREHRPDGGDPVSGYRCACGEDFATLAAREWHIGDKLDPDPVDVVAAIEPAHHPDGCPAEDWITPKIGHVQFELDPVEDRSLITLLFGSDAADAALESLEPVELTKEAVEQALSVPVNVPVPPEPSSEEDDPTETSSELVLVDPAEQALREAWARSDDEVDILVESIAELEAGLARERSKLADAELRRARSEAALSVYLGEKLAVEPALDVDPEADGDGTDDPEPEPEPEPEPAPATVERAKTRAKASGNKAALAERYLVDGRYRCPADGCGRDFSRPNGLSRHLNEGHGTPIDTLPDPKGHTTNRAIGTAPKAPLHRCPFSGCEYTTTNPARLEKHQSTNGHR